MATKSRYSDYTNWYDNAVEERIQAIRRVKGFQETIYPAMKDDGLSDVTADIARTYFVNTGRMPDDMKEVPGLYESAQKDRDFSKDQEEMAKAMSLDNLVPKPKAPTLPVKQEASKEQPKPEAKKGIIDELLAIRDSDDGLISKSLQANATIADKLFGTNLAGAVRHSAAGLAATSAANEVKNKRLEIEDASPEKAKQRLESQLETILSGEAYTSHYIGNGEYMQSKMTPAELKQAEADLRKQIAEIDEKAYTEESVAERLKLHSEYGTAVAKANEAKAKVDATKEGLTPGSARFAYNVGQGLRPTQVAPMVVGGITAATVPALTVPAAAVASIPQAIEVYRDSKYEAVVDFDADPVSADMYAATLTAIEFGADSITSASAAGLLLGKDLLKSLGKGAAKKAAKAALTERVRSIKSRVAGAAVHQVAGELVANEASHQVRSAATKDETFGTAEGRQAVAEELKDRDRLEEAIDTVQQLTPLIGAGVPVAVASHRKDVANKRDATLLAHGLHTDAYADANERRAAEAKAEEEAKKRVTEAPTAEMFDTEAEGTFEEQDAARRKQQEEDAAWSIRNRERAEEANDTSAIREVRRKELLDNSARRVEEAEDRLDSIRAEIEDGDTSQATLNAANAAARVVREAKDLHQSLVDSLSAEEKTETAAAQEQATVEESVPLQRDMLNDLAQDEAAADAVAVEAQAESDVMDRANLEADALARLQAAKEAKDKAAAKEEAKRKAAEAKRREEIANKILDENPNLTVQELVAKTVDAFEAESSTPIEESPAKPESKPEAKEPSLEDKVKKAIDKVQANQKRRATNSERRRIEALVKKYPEASREEIVEMLKNQTADEAPFTKTAEESRAATEAARANSTLAMKAPDGTTVQTDVPAPETRAERKNVTERVSDLLKKMSPSNRENNSIYNLLLQGKLIITDRPSSIGRADSQNIGEYDTADGKLFVYLDNIEDGADVRTEILKSIISHEGTHAGQFSQREGRADVFKYLMGDKGNAEANERIRSLAESGNVAAQEAVRKAKEAAEHNKEFDGDVESLELVPYFMSELKGKPLGMAGKVARDVKAAVAKTARGLGMDLDFTLDEISRAADLIAEEIEKTTLTPEGEGTLGVAVGENATEFESLGGKHTGKFDGKERRLMSDADSSVNVNNLEDFYANSQDSLGNIFNHDRLYKNYPELKDLVVRIANHKDRIGDRSYYDPISNTITLKQSTADALKDGGGRGTLLHEIQHAIQNIEGFTSGDNPASFENPQKLAAYEYAEEIRKKSVDSFPLTKWHLTVDQATSEKVYDMFGDNKEKSARYIIDNKLLGKSRDPQVRAFDVGKFNSVAVAHRKAHLDLLNDRMKAMEKYLSIYGETEARTVSMLKDLTQEELNEINFHDKMGEEEFSKSYGVSYDTTTDDYRGAKSTSLGMRGTVNAQGVPRQRISYYEQARRLVESGLRERNHDLKAGEHFDVVLYDAIASDSSTGMLTDVMNDKMLELMTSELNDIPSERAKMWAEAEKDMPNVVKVLKDIRNFLTEQSFTLLDELESPTRDMSASEIATADTIRANLNTYLTRFYAAYTPGKGKKWAEKRMGIYDKYKNLSDLSGLSDKEREAVEAVREGIKALEKSIAIPDDTTLESMTMQQLSDKFELVDPNGRKMEDIRVDPLDPDQTEARREAAINILADIRDNMDTSRLSAIADDYAREMLGIKPSNKNWIQKLGGVTKDPGTLKHRVRVPLEVRRMLGEINTAPGAILATFHAQAALKARAITIGEMLRDGMGIDVLTPEQYQALPATRGILDFTTDIKSEFIEAEGNDWGKAKGLYVRKQYHDRIDTIDAPFMTWMDAIDKQGLAGLSDVIVGRALPKTLGRANRLHKMSTVIGNPVSWAGNGASSFLLTIDNGNFSPDTYYKGVVGGVKYMQSAFTDKTSPILQDIIRYVNIESANIAEVQKILGQRMEKYLDGTLPIEDAYSTLQKYVSDPARRTARGVIAAYSIMDNWSKIANFYHRVGVLSEVNVASGGKLSPHEIATQAGHDVSLTNISSERAHPIIAGGENVGVTSFMPYIYEVFRTRLTGYALAYSDYMQGKDYKAQGHTKAGNILQNEAIKRLVGHTVASGFLPMTMMAKHFPNLTTIVGGSALIGMGGALSGGDDENKMRRLLSPMNRNSQIFKMATNIDGNPVYLNFSQKWDALGPETDAIRAMITADKGERAEALFDYVAEDVFIFSNFLKKLGSAMSARPADSDTLALLGELSTKYLGKDLRANLEAAAGDPDKVNRALLPLDSFIPGVLKGQLTRNRAGEVSQIDSNMINRISKATGVAGEDILSAMNDLGFTFETLNPVPAMTVMMSESKRAKSQANNDLSRRLINTSTDTPITEDAAKSAISRWITSEQKRQFENYKIIEGMQAWEYDNNYIKSLLKEGKYPAKEIDSVMNGDYNITLSASAITSYVSGSVRFKDTTRKASLKDKEAEVITMLKKLEPWINEQGVNLSFEGVGDEYK